MSDSTTTIAYVVMSDSTTTITHVVQSIVMKSAEDYEVTLLDKKTNKTKTLPAKASSVVGLAIGSLVGIQPEAKVFELSSNTPRNSPDEYKKLDAHA